MTDETSDLPRPTSRRERFTQSKLFPVIIAVSLLLTIGGAVAVEFSTDRAPEAPAPTIKSEVQEAVESEARHAILDKALADAEVAFINAGDLEHKSVTTLQNAVADCTDLPDDIESTTLIDCSDRITIAIGAVVSEAAESTQRDAG